MGIWVPGLPGRQKMSCLHVLSIHLPLTRPIALYQHEAYSPCPSQTVSSSRYVALIRHRSGREELGVEVWASAQGLVATLSDTHSARGDEQAAISPPHISYGYTDAQLANIAIFVVSLGSNVYSVAGPEDMYGSSKVTYITPSYYVSWHRCRDAISLQ